MANMFTIYNRITILFLGKIKGSFDKNVLENDRDSASRYITFCSKMKKYMLV
jgi:hypothetical protein